ncbi:MAG TPA: MATE family efflux transporter [Bacteroidales bacterium]|nr:MATE family efflux transporter [Bacteroidales bacterium]
MASENNKRIAKNTMFLYFRQILILFVSLYTVRVVLDVLGVEDYGIYSVVAGIVSFFSFLSGTMASATQRFFSFALGKNDTEKLKKTFSVNLLIYGGIAIIALLLLETVGLWFVNEHLQVPPNRFEAAKWVYHFSVLMFIATIFSTPFMSIIIAHEDMKIYAYVSIVEVVMKLGVVFLLLYVPFDKLELYGVLTFAVSVIITILYAIICMRKYLECQFRIFYWDKLLLKEIVGFTGWTLFGQLSSVGRNQAVTILLNQFFNPVVVAARAIAVNITNNITVFANNFNTGLYPPIIKYYASGQKEEMFKLIFNGSKITFFLMWVFALPLLLEMDIVLKLWLKNPPEYTVLFTRLALIEVLIISLSLPLATAARAPGKMKTYELSLGTIQIAIFIASWIILKMGAEAYSVFLIAILANIIMFFARLLIVKQLIEIDVKLFILKVVFPIFIIIILSFVPTYCIFLFLPKGILFSIITVILSVIICSLTMYFVGIDKKMRNKIHEIVINKARKFFK